MLCNSSCFCCRLLTFSKLTFSKKSFKNTIRMSNDFDWDQDKVFSVLIGLDKQKFLSYNWKCFLIHQFEHMFWVLKRTVSLRWFFWVPTIYVLVEKYENYFLLRTLNKGLVLIRVKTAYKGYQQMTKVAASKERDIDFPNQCLGLGDLQFILKF